MNSWKKIEERSKIIISEQLGIDINKVNIDSQFVDDLGADSLDSVELVMAFEEEFECEIPNSDADQILSLAHGIKYFVTNRSRELYHVVKPQVLAFKVLGSGLIEVSIRLEDGSWTYSGGKTLLPSKLYIIQYSKWADILKELEEMINYKKVKENDLQGYFERYPELLAADDYDHIIPQATIARCEIDTDWKADFVLAPYNQTEFSKIIELKLPTMQLTTKPRSGHVNFSAKLWRAITQLKDYSKIFDSPHTRKIFQEKYNTDVFKPDLQLIAGRRWDLLWVDSINSLRRDSGVNIEDWDSLLDRLKRKFA